MDDEISVTIGEDTYTFSRWLSPINYEMAEYINKLQMQLRAEKATVQTMKDMSGRYRKTMSNLALSEARDRIAELETQRDYWGINGERLFGYRKASLARRAENRRLRQELEELKDKHAYSRAYIIQLEADREELLKKIKS